MAGGSGPSAIVAMSGMHVDILELCFFQKKNSATSLHRFCIAWFSGVAWELS